jgi:hypothetical protein
LRNQGRHTDIVTTNGDAVAVGLVYDVVDKLEVVRVRDHLVSGDNVLEVESARGSRVSGVVELAGEAWRFELERAQSRELELRQPVQTKESRTL